MYLPGHFRVDDPGPLHELMRRFSFATLVSVHEGRPFATPLPFVLDAGRNRLEAHMARANPQWTTLEANPEVLVIFQGDHSYVSPSWYEKHPSVPTWNYVTVHAYGKARLVEEPEAVKAMLRGLVRQHEPAWDMDALPASYLEGMVKGVVAFEVEIARLEGKFKLSQNRSAADRRRVAEALAQSPDPAGQGIARRMAERLEER
ncbi:Protease synthase and sporulation protein PAI 2 [Calidithermus terrae]|uniref:Protease synthase and sporulation protein PAI 2 n=1 Tax=Calidithermus terrae TaxID=1408545 RepID=A0A399EEU4_9DEIN|nr:FMN-binding negative transcriptional regulator [Calidithermus terrae]RIH82063.1 Protease synthase and sporulation protein PAI 2 [Calidithermus terrae]